MHEVDGIMHEAMDNYIGAEIMVSHGDTLTQGSVRCRKRNVERNTIGRANSNPILDTQSYEVKFKYGSMSPYSEICIAQSMYAKCDN